MILITCFNNRPKVSEIFLQDIQRKNYLDKLYVGCSVASDALLCQKYNVQHVMLPNNPVGRKWNKTIQWAVSQSGWADFVLTGDDDLITAQGWQQLIDCPSHWIAGFKSNYILEPTSHRAALFCYPSPGVRKIGAYKKFNTMNLTMCRCEVLKHAVLQNMGYNVEQELYLPIAMATYLESVEAVTITSSELMVFHPKLDRRLDFSSDIFAISRGNSFMDLIGDHVVDIKTPGNNMWSFDQVLTRSQAVDYDEVVEKFKLNELPAFKEVGVV